MAVTICKQSAPCSRQITTPTSHYSIFTGRMFFLVPNKQCQKTQGIYLHIFCSSASSSCQSHTRLYGSANIHFHSFGMTPPLLQKNLYFIHSLTGNTTKIARITALLSNHRVIKYQLVKSLAVFMFPSFL